MKWISEKLEGHENTVTNLLRGGGSGDYGGSDNRQGSATLRIDAGKGRPYSEILTLLRLVERGKTRMCVFVDCKICNSTKGGRGVLIRYIYYKSEPCALSFILEIHAYTQ